MPAFQIRLRSRRVQRELDSLLETDYIRVAAKIKSIANNPKPQGVEKLYDNIFRVRVGDIRIIYSLDTLNTGSSLQTLNT